MLPLSRLLAQGNTLCPWLTDLIDLRSQLRAFSRKPSWFSPQEGVKDFLSAPMALHSHSPEEVPGASPSGLASPVRLSVLSSPWGQVHGLDHGVGGSLLPHSLNRNLLSINQCVTLYL